MEVFSLGLSRRWVVSEWSRRFSPVCVAVEVGSDGGLKCRTFYPLVVFQLGLLVVRQWRLAPCGRRRQHPPV